MWQKLPTGAWNSFPVVFLPQWLLQQINQMTLPTCSGSHLNPVVCATNTVKCSRVAWHVGATCRTQIKPTVHQMISHFYFYCVRDQLTVSSPSRTENKAALFYGVWHNFTITSRQSDAGEVGDNKKQSSGTSRPPAGQSGNVIGPRSGDLQEIQLGH